MINSKINMTIKENKQLIYNFYKGFNAQDIDDSFEKYVSPDLKVYVFGKTLSQREWKDIDKNVFLSFSDFKINLKIIVVIVAILFIQSILQDRIWNLQRLQQILF